MLASEMSPDSAAGPDGASTLLPAGFTSSSVLSGRRLSSMSSSEPYVVVRVFIINIIIIIICNTPTEQYGNRCYNKSKLTKRKEKREEEQATQKHIQ